jgi:hypothetical protein
MVERSVAIIGLIRSIYLGFEPVARDDSGHFSLRPGEKSRRRD